MLRRNFLRGLFGGAAALAVGRVNLAAPAAVPNPQLPVEPYGTQPGDDGCVGPVGFEGAQGYVGPVGPVGYTGYEGPRGVASDRVVMDEYMPREYMQGPIGPKGSQGRWEHEMAAKPVFDKYPWANAPVGRQVILKTGRQVSKSTSQITLYRRKGKR